MCTMLKYFLKIDGTTLDDTEDLDLVTPMYHLLGWNSNYCGTTGSFKVELKIKWTNHCVLWAKGNDDDDANSNSIIITIKDTKLYVPVVTLSAKDNQKLSKFLSKVFQRSMY